MNGLRWVLLLLGLAFIGALAWWELRRPRQAGRHEPSFESQHTDNPQPALPSRPATRNTDAHRPLPVIDWPAMEDDNDRMGAPSPTTAATLTGDAVQTLSGNPQAAAPVDSATTLVPPVPEPASPIVDWPPERERQICNLRVVPRHQERFPGRSLRQGLQGCGFRHGEFGIFHMPGPDQRVVLSAANLARPGLLDPQNMDYQRFSGVNVFAVLPGPLPVAQTLQQLFDVANDLAERVDGNVLDDSGALMDGARMDQLRARILGDVPDAASGY